MPKLSIVWKHFVDIGQGYARCKICQKEVKGCGNTTNFTFHLERTHRMTLNKSETKATKSIKRKLSHSRKVENVEAESMTAISCEKENVQAESMAAISSISTDSQTETACATSSINYIQSLKPKQPRVDDTFAKQLSFKSGSKATEMNCKLCFMLAKDIMPLNTVEKEGFQEFVKALNPLYQLPCRNITTALIEEKYSYLSDIIKKRLSGIKALSLTTDIWTETFNSKSFLGFTVHYIFNDECKSVVIGVEELDKEYTSNNIKDWLISMLDEWGIELKNVVAVVSDNAANIKKAIIDAFGADKHLPCFAHTLNLVPSKIIGSDKLISPVITKIKEIVKYVKKSVNASDLLRLYSSSF